MFLNRCLLKTASIIAVAQASLSYAQTPLAPGAAPQQAEAQLQARTMLPAGVKRSETQVFGNWTVTCEDPAESGARRRCNAALHLAPAGSAQPVLSWIIAFDAKGVAQFTILTPTGVKIAPGVEVKIGKGAARKAAFSACENRCQAELATGEAGLKDLRDSENFTVTIVNTREESISFTAQTTGAAAAIDAMKR